MRTYQVKMSYEPIMTVIGLDMNRNGIQDGTRDRVNSTRSRLGGLIRDATLFYPFDMFTDIHEQFIAA